MHVIYTRPPGRFQSLSRKGWPADHAQSEAVFRGICAKYCAVRSSCNTSHSLQSISGELQMAAELHSLSYIDAMPAAPLFVGHGIASSRHVQHRQWQARRQSRERCSRTLVPSRLQIRSTLSSRSTTIQFYSSAAKSLKQSCSREMEPTQRALPEREEVVR